MHMHSAISPSPSSSSLRNRRMKEIVEDAEEGATPRVSPAIEETRQPDTALSARSVDTDASSLPPSALRAKVLLAKRRQADSIGGQSTNVPDVLTAPREVAKEVGTVASNGTVDVTYPNTRTESLDRQNLPPITQKRETDLEQDVALSVRESLDYRLREESDSDDDGPAPVRRHLVPAPVQSGHLSALESSSISRWTEDVIASTGGDQRRAQMPSNDSVQRPKTSGTMDSSTSGRRVANLPQSIRVSSRPQQQVSRPGSQQSSRSFPVRYVPSTNLPPPLPSPTFATEHAMPPPMSRSYHAPSHTSSGPYDGPAATPEKLRLMKALQMRKRNQLLGQRLLPATVLESTPEQPSRSTTSALPGAPPVMPASAAACSVEPFDASQHGEVSSILRSSTTSPTSLTASDHESTKPSSAEGQSIRRTSKHSLSSNTDSSTTPRISQLATLTTIKRDINGTASGGDRQTARDIPGVTTMSAAKQETAPATAPATTQSHAAVHGDQATTEGTDVNSDVTSLAAPSPSRSTTRRSKKRTISGESMKIATHFEDAETSDDDSLMEELQHATVHEAKPMFVNRTPVTPVLAKAPTFASSRESTSRADLNLVEPTSPQSRSTTPERKRTASRTGSVKSVSTALPQWPPLPTTSVPLVPKKNLAIGNTISKRIKDLERVRSRDSATSSGQVKKESLNRISTFSNVMKRSSFLSQFQQGTVTPGNGSPTTVTSFQSQMDKHEGEPPTTPRPWAQFPGPGTASYQPAIKGETVSVTTQIVRGVGGYNRQASDSVMGLHKSPSTVEGETARGTPQRPTMRHGASAHSVSARPRSPTVEKRRFSFSSRKESPASTVRQRMSFASSKKSAAQSEASSTNGEVKSSKTGRMLKRLSGLGRRNQKAVGTSPTRESLYGQRSMIEEKWEADSRQESFDSVRHVVDVGEVNVQFPETLLWKRRFLRVDDQGYLVFSPPVSDFNARGRNRKYHLSDFMAPALPDLEREEMAWSIVLDLIDGQTVQCACESRTAQQSALKSECQIFSDHRESLLTSHSAH